MRLLITGSNGLLGQKLISALRNDPDVELLATSRGTDRTSVPLGDRYRALDITDPEQVDAVFDEFRPCLLYTSPSPRDRTRSRMPSSA